MSEAKKLAKLKRAVEQVYFNAMLRAAEETYLAAPPWTPASTKPATKA